MIDLARIRAWLRNVRSIIRRFVRLEPEKMPIGFELSPDWFRVICKANIRLLQYPGMQHGSRVRKSQGKLPDSGWKTALNALGAALCSQYHDDIAAQKELELYFASHVGPDGSWLTNIKRVENVMKGYPLLFLTEHTQSDRYKDAAHSLARALVDEYPRMFDGSLPYQSFSQEILVDTLAMVCPFLTRYGMKFGNAEALNLGIRQLLSFVQNNVDAHTYLPYHGYYADGPKCLGLHAWGRGVGWYMMGLVDTLAELPPEQHAYQDLRAAFVRAADALRSFQRPDGHWNWAILHRKDKLDSSTTALVGYSLMRGLMLGLLDVGFEPSITAALKALVGVTRADGVLDQGLGECRGLGKYPQTYGPQPWLQGAATAFAALYFQHFGGSQP